ncbi:MAG: hypothetical protein E4H41_06310 [Gemmatimonadales bacterium]|jgi:hypothetical protein|nr:MAG: hypothetical protein E4H41_06310 [Gemmatimonadales bacterium]
MRRLLALPLLAIALTGCPSYDSYTPVVSQQGLIPPDQFARYGKEQAQAIAIGREFGYAYQGDTPADYGAQAAAGAAYARTMPDVLNVTADSLGHRLTLQFRSGWRTAVDPIADGRRGHETPGIAAAAPAS